MKSFGLPKGLVDSVSSLLKQSSTPDVNLQEKIRRDNAQAKKQQDAFTSAYTSVVGEERKKAAEEQTRFVEQAAKAHLRMGKSIVEGTAPKSAKEKELAAKKEPKNKITHADVLAARGVKLEEIGITDDLLQRLATAMVTFSTTKRQAVALDEQKDVIAAMARSLLLSIDQMVEENVDKEIRSQVAFLKAITEAKINIQAQLINSINIGNAVSRVNEASKIKKFLDDAFAKETIKSRQAKIQADVSDEIQYKGEVIDELSKTTIGSYVKKASKDAVELTQRADGEHEYGDPREGGKLDKKAEKRVKNIDRAVNRLTKESWEDMMKAVRDRAKPQPNGGAGKKQGTAYGGSKQKDEKPVREETDTPGNSYEHQCAIHVKHSKLGEGKTLFSQHAEPDAQGQIAWYDIMFEHGIEKRVPTADLEILVSESHMNHKKKKK